MGQKEKTNIRETNEETVQEIRPPGDEGTLLEWGLGEAPSRSL